MENALNYALYPRSQKCKGQINLYQKRRGSRSRGIPAYPDLASLSLARFCRACKPHLFFHDFFCGQQASRPLPLPPQHLHLQVAFLSCVCAGHSRRWSAVLAWTLQEWLVSAIVARCHLPMLTPRADVVDGFHHDPSPPCLRAACRGGQAFETVRSLPSASLSSSPQYLRALHDEFHQLGISPTKLKHAENTN